MQNLKLKAKSDYYSNSQWYSKLKRMSSHDQLRSEEVIVEEISHLSNQNQAEAIADNFSQISNEYEPLNAEDINLDDIDGPTANLS